MTSKRIAVLLMAYGTPRTKDEILPYYTDIRRGRPPTPELLDELIDLAIDRHSRRRRNTTR